MQNLKFGAKRSHPDKLAAAKPAHEHPAIKAALAAGPLPDSVDLDVYTPFRADQGASGSCTAGSSTLAVATAFAAKGKPLGFVPSQLATYRQTRALERAAQFPAGPLPVLTDDGAQLADVVTVFGQFGIMPMVVSKTPDGRLYDLWTDADVPGQGNVNAEPQLSDLELSAQKLVDGPYLVANGDATGPDVIAAALAACIPVCLAFFCDSAFQRLGPNDVAQKPNEADSTGGGHAVWLSGYKHLPSGERVFLLTNSWGNGWCDNGRVMVSEAFIRAAWEAWPLAIKEVP